MYEVVTSVTGKGCTEFTLATAQSSAVEVSQRDFLSIVIDLLNTESSPPGEVLAGTETAGEGGIYT